MAYKDKSNAIKYNNNFIKEAYDRINLTVPKGRKAELQAVAERHGQSVNGFINSLIDEALERERAGAVPCDTSAGREAPTIGSNEWWAKRRPKQPQEGGGDGSTGEQFPYFQDDGDTPPAAVGFSPMQSEESSPAEQIFPDLEEDDGELPF